MKISRRSFLQALSAAALSACHEAVVEKRGGADPLAALGSHPLPAAIRVAVPPFAGERSAAALAPLAHYLEEILKIPTQTVIAKNYDDVSELLRSGSAELAFFTPAAFVKAREHLPAVPIATATRAGSPTYLGYLVVKSSDPADTLAALRGKSIAWVDVASTSGYLYPRALLRARGFDPDKFFSRTVMTGDHNKSLEMLIHGEVEVAAVTSQVFDRPRVELAAGVRELRVVAKTGRIPLDCMVVHSGVDRDLAIRLRAALLGVVHSTETSEALAVGWGIRGFVPFASQRYDDLAEVLRRGA